MGMNELLIRIGINPKLRGYRYLCEACMERVRDPDGKTTAIYYAVAKRNNVSYECTERSIRYAVERMCDEVRAEKYVKYLLKEPSVRSGKYASSTFISLAAEAYIRENDSRQG